MSKLIFEVTMCVEDGGGYVARWNDPTGGGITTQGNSFAELDAMVLDAVGGYFADAPKPVTVRLHFVDDPVLTVA